MASQALTLPLLWGTTTLKVALEQEENMLFDVAYLEQPHRKDIEGTVSYHLGVTSPHAGLEK